MILSGTSENNELHWQRKKTLLHPKSWLARTAFVLVDDLRHNNDSTDINSLMTHIGLSRKNVEQVVRRLTRSQLVRPIQEGDIVHRVVQSGTEKYIGETRQGTHGALLTLKNGQATKEDHPLLQNLPIEVRRDFQVVLPAADDALLQQNNIISYLSHNSGRTSRTILAHILSCNEQGESPSGYSIAWHHGYNKSKHIATSLNGLVDRGLLIRSYADLIQPRKIKGAGIYRIPDNMIHYAEAARSGFFGPLRPATLIPPQTSDGSVQVQ